MDALPSEGLPPGWAHTTLGEVAGEPRARVPADAKSNLPFVGLEHIAPHALRPHGFGRFGDMRSAASPFTSGDVLYARMRPYLNKVWHADREGVASAEFLVLPRSGRVHPDFLALLLHHRPFVEFARHASSGDRPRVEWADISKYPIALPPRAEQDRIVAAVNALFEEVEAGEAALARAREGLMQFRASLLHAACTGALTADWRAANPTNETADDLLAQIMEARGDSIGRRGRSLLPPDLSNEPTLPFGWRWASVDQVTNFLGNGLARAPDGDATDLRILRISAVRPLKVDQAEHRFYRPLPGENVAGATTQRHDLLFTRYSGSEHYVGVCGLVRFAEPMLFPDKVMCARPLPGFTDLAEYLEIALNAGPSRAYIARNIRTTAGQKGIAGSSIRACPVPVPPRSELAAIIAAVREALAEATALPTDAFAAQLRQSILHAAFTGRLVPQDPTDEPAAALLARLRAAPPRSPT
jgi:type I restriction enzyme S subunit